MSAFSYPTTGGVCQEALKESLQSQNCHSEGTPLVLRDSEVMGQQLISALELFASQECRDVGIPLLCMYLFGVCSSSGVSLQPTSSQCKSARDDLCNDAWVLAQGFGADLPDCDNFPVEQVSCPENETENISESIIYIHDGIKDKFVAPTFLFSVH